MPTGTPSWVLVLLDRVRELRDARGEKHKPVYPNLEMFVHGVNFAPYRGRFLKLFEGLTVDMREVYATSEGFVASADRGFGEGLRMNIMPGCLQFVPLEELSNANPSAIGSATPNRRELCPGAGDMRGRLRICHDDTVRLGKIAAAAAHYRTDLIRTLGLWRASDRRRDRDRCGDAAATIGADAVFRSAPCSKAMKRRATFTSGL